MHVSLQRLKTKTDTKIKRFLIFFVFANYIVKTVNRELCVDMSFIILEVLFSFQSSDLKAMVFMEVAINSC